MLDDLGMSGSALKAAAPTAYPNNANLSKDFINSKVLFTVIGLVLKILSCILWQLLAVIVYAECGQYTTEH